MKIQPANLKIDYVALQGGEDLITPSLSVNPGRSILSQNYEMDPLGRYRLIDGYERFDGRTSPSQAPYWILGFDTGSVEVVIGDTLLGAAASGEVLEIVLLGGNWPAGDAQGYFVLVNLAGAFVDNEAVAVAGVPVAVADGVVSLNGATNDSLDSIYSLAAAEHKRADIQEVPGSGRVLGVWQYQGVKYAFRDNLLGTAALMYRSSIAGWVLCGLGETVYFDNGTIVFVEGETLTQGAVTATVKRVIVTSGSWAGADAVGRMVIYSRAGGNFAAGAVVGSAGGAATLSGVQIPNSLPSGGRYEFVTHNFGGHSGQRRMYAVNGVGTAFEWDGAVFVPILTGMVADTPNHIAAHKGHLFLSFPGGSLQHSSLPAAVNDPVFPYIWSAVTGAGEIGLGDEITGLISMVNALIVFTRNSTQILYGASSADWELRPHSDESGAIEWTIQKIGTGVFLDDRGISSLSASDKHGDFEAGVLSKYVQPFLKPIISRAVASVRVKEKNHYRIFFDNMAALTVGLDGDQVIGITRQLYDRQVSCICSAEDLTGREEIFFGATDGFVYQMDSGTSFDGRALEAVLKLHFNHLKSPSVIKRIRKIVLELSAPINTYISAGVEFDYGGSDDGMEVFSLEQPGGVWGVDTWGEFVWDGRTIASAPLDIDGSGENFSLTLYHSGVWELQNQVQGFPLVFPFVFSIPRSGITGALPHTLQGYTVHYDIRKVQR
jgi:hypothetical protein